MPQLLQDIIYIIETFQKYAREEGDCWTLSLGQLKQLLLAEIGEFLKPFDSLTAGTNLSLLDRDGDETISFDEFILLAFDLLNICFRDIQSFLNREPKAESDAEKELPEDTEVWETSEFYREEAGLGQYEQRLTGTESPSLISPIEKAPETLAKKDPQDDLETPRLLGREAEHIHPKSQSQGEGDEQIPERTRVQERSDRVPPEEKRPPKEFVKRAYSQKEEKTVSEGYEVPRKQGGTNTKDQPSEQEREQNMEIQSVDTKERAWRTSESQEKTIIKEAGEHTETQESSSQENHKRPSERADLSTEKAEEKLPETKRLAEYRDDVVYLRCPDIQEPLIQREYETQDVLAKSNDNRIPKIGVLVDETKGKRKSENTELAGQKGSEEDSQIEILTKQELDWKEKQLEGLGEEGDTGKDSVTPDLKAEADQNHPEHKGPAASEKEVTVSEISEPEFSGDNRSDSVAERTPETKDSIQGSEPQDNQSGGKNRRSTQTLDQPTVLGDKSRTPETEVPVDREHSENTTEELEKLTEENEKKSPVDKTPVTAEESGSQPGARESIKQKVTAMSPKTEITDPTEENDRGLSLVHQSEKEDQGKNPEVHDPEVKEEESESQDAPPKGQDPETQDLTLESSPDALSLGTKEDRGPQRLGEVNEQHVANKEDDSSPVLSEQLERKSREVEPAQPDLPAPEGHLSQSDMTQVYGPELRLKRELLRNQTSEDPTLLNPLWSYRQEPMSQVGDPEPDEEYGGQQETLAYQQQEDEY